MNRILRTAAVTVAALATAVTVAAAPASASSLTADRSATPAAAKLALTARIDKRLAALKQFDSTLNSAKQVQQAHRATLSKLIDDQTAGLTTLRAKIQTETTREALKADAKSMVFDFRVFILTGPKVRLTAAIDTELAAAAKLPGSDDIQESLSGKVDTLLAIKPGPDGDAIRTQVKTIRESAKSARADLKKLRKTK